MSGYSSATLFASYPIDLVIVLTAQPVIPDPGRVRHRSVQRRSRRVCGQRAPSTCPRSKTRSAALAHPSPAPRASAASGTHIRCGGDGVAPGPAHARRPPASGARRRDLPGAAAPGVISAAPGHQVLAASGSPATWPAGPAPRRSRPWPTHRGAQRCRASGTAGIRRRRTRRASGRASWSPGPPGRLPDGAAYARNPLFPVSGPGPDRLCLRGPRGVPAGAVDGSAGRGVPSAALDDRNYLDRGNGRGHVRAGRRASILVVKFSEVSGHTANGGPMAGAGGIANGLGRPSPPATSRAAPPRVPRAAGSSSTA